MVPPDRCPVCGTPRPADASEGMCPGCLMRLGLDSPGVTIDLPSGAPAAGVLETIASTVGAVPRVLLRDTDGGLESPVVRPGAPVGADPSIRYRIDGEIARGGMGSILKGRDPDLGRDVALKVLRDDLRDNADLVRRFVEEAQIGGQLQHPGIVPIYELGTFPDRRPYFTMKLVKGHTLAALLEARKDPSEDRPRFLGIFEQVAQTIAYAHARGVIHRDLKPSNVMVGSFGEVQLMDWGLAKVLSRGGASDDATAGRDAAHTVIATARDESDADLSRAGSVLGTPAYMAPEQARGEVEAVDARADVFALGSMLCEVLTGQPAFTGCSAGEIQRKAARGDLADAFARLAACGADAELLALARDCLAPERDDRPRDASAFVERLSGYLTSIEQRLRATEMQRADEHARAEEAVRRVQVERQRRRYQAGLAASLLVLSVVGTLAFGSWMRQRQARENRIAMAVQQAVFLRDQAVAEPNDVGRWESARRGIDAATRTLADLDAPAAAKALEPLGQEAQAGLTAARRGPGLIEALTAARTAAGQLRVFGVEDLYAPAFREAGLGLDAMTPAALGAAIRGLPEPAARAAITALDDWAMTRRQFAAADTPWQRPLEAARAADPDPFRDRVRGALLETDAATRGAALRALVADPQAAELSPQSAVLLARVLCEEEDLPAEAVADMLRAVVARHPEDFPANFTLANVLLLLTPPAREEAVAYFRAARALWPISGGELARVLRSLGRTDEATAIDADLFDRYPSGWYGLADLCLRNHQYTAPAARIDAMLAAGRQAVERFPEKSSAHAMLATALLARGRRDEAIAELREAIDRERNVVDRARTEGDTTTTTPAGYPKVPDPPPGDDPIARELWGVPLFYLHQLLALALRDQGDFAGALDALDAVQEGTGGRLRFSVGPQLAEIEPMAQLAGRLDGVLEGWDRPTRREDLRTFAYMAYYVQHYDAATHHFAAALESDTEPQNPDHQLDALRYDAACAAALAGSGQGRDAPPPEGPARAQRRRQALQWLRTNLTLSGGQHQPIASCPALAHWEHAPDLAGIRDARALEALPVEERRDWQALWAEVERRVTAEAARSWLGVSGSY